MSQLRRRSFSVSQDGLLPPLPRESGHLGMLFEWSDLNEASFHPYLNAAHLWLDNSGRILKPLETGTKTNLVLISPHFFPDSIVLLLQKQTPFYHLLCLCAQQHIPVGEMGEQSRFPAKLCAFWKAKERWREGRPEEPEPTKSEKERLTELDRREYSSWEDNKILNCARIMTSGLKRTQKKDSLKEFVDAQQ